ncbi:MULTISPECIES: peptidylprolyl isomerase [Sphingomonas]|uniref:peptidylprolyl isomerase n=2 Tax=Sphingomonadaceae TaxID=41297 RepID=UPI0006F97B57|nr:MULTISPECIES: peptidylprolyl isomerase [Sphingomonas]KQM91619.1 peptidylprolyl isomerase [Sphingomonas sp. Leaf226]MDY0967265.1 SurA N-terminal domain-containing protein [Sphingomonas sp. CFBP9021]USQ99195.1 SurA N-terminal domain-containing protein [Sphingomonas aerolata]
MLSFFRRLTQSRFGVIITFGLLGVIALAFAAGDMTGLGGGTSGIAADDVATVGKADVTANELRTRVQTEMEGFRQQQPTLDMASYVQQGGFDGTLDRITASLALEQFGRQQGMVVSKRAVDGQIASIPALQGPTGKFDPSLYQRVLVERKLTDAQIRADIVRDTYAQQLILPTRGASQVPSQLALPFASLLLEKRSGLVGFIPTAAVPAGPAPTDAELNAFYRRNVARYTIPERRVIRYAVVDAAQVKAQAVPTDAEIAAQYQQDRARYASTEKRTITQVVVADQAGAAAIAAKVKAGTAIADAARAAGLEASTQTGVEKAVYAGTTSPQVADAVFAAANAAVVGPVRTPLGWTIARIDSIQNVPAKTLDQARGEIATALSAQKAQAALGKIHDAIDDGLSDNATFDEIIADRKLTAITTPGLVANGTNPDTPGTQPDAALAPIVSAAFQAAEGDAPQMVQTGSDGSFAVVALGRVVRAAPRPLAQVRPAVMRDLMADRASQAARKYANAALARINKGMPLQQALGQSGFPVPPARPVTASRAQIMQNPENTPPVLRLMFSMAQGTAKTIAGPDGWFVVKLDKIDRGNATGNQAAIQAARGSIARSVGREYVDQFVKAVRAQVGVKTDPKAVARVRAELLAQGGSNN